MKNLILAILTVSLISCDDEMCFIEVDTIEKPECQAACVSASTCELGYGLVLEEFSCDTGVCCEPQETPCTDFDCNTPPEPHCVENHLYQGNYYDAVQHYATATCKFNEAGTAWCEYHVDSWEVCVGNGTNGFCEDGRCIYNIPDTDQ